MTSGHKDNQVTRLQLSMVSITPLCHRNGKSEINMKLSFFNQNIEKFYSKSDSATLRNL